MSIGVVGLEDVAGAYSDRAFPMSDLYRLIGFLGDEIYDDVPKPNDREVTSYIKEIWLLLQHIFDYFQEIPLQNRIIYYRDNIKNKEFKAPEKYCTPEWTYDRILTKLAQDYDLPLYSDLDVLRRNNVFVPQFNSAMNVCQFYQQISNTGVPRTALEYCDLINTLLNDKRISVGDRAAAIEWLDSNFNAEMYYRNFYPTTNNDLTKLDEEIEKVFLPKTNDIIPDITGVPTSVLTDPTVVTTYMSRLNLLLRAKNIVFTAATFVRDNICALSYQKKYEPYKEQLASLKESVEVFMDYIQTQKQILRGNVNYALIPDWINMRSVPKEIIDFWKNQHAKYLLVI